MRKLLSEVDQLLRGNLSKREDLREGRISGRVGNLIAAGIFLGVTYGIFMGLYAALRSKDPTGHQLWAASLKVPLLFLLTLFVTFPSLYVCCALSGSPLRLRETARLLLMGIVVDLALLASFGPITGFFTLCTKSYSFMVLLNVLFFTIGGLAGLAFLRRGLSAMFEKDPTATQARLVLQVWVLIYGAVGAQMGWILRPFIGSPDLPFTLFRHRQSSFFEAVILGIRNLFS